MKKQLLASEKGILSLKKFYEKISGRKFTDEEFMAIFEIAYKKNPRLLENFYLWEYEELGFEMELDGATNEWEKGIHPTKNGDHRREIGRMIKDMENVIDYYAHDKNANWGTVGTLANIHESLGEEFYVNYEEHRGYSASIEDGIKRHSGKAKDILSMMASDVEMYHEKEDFGRLAHLKNFFTDLLEGFQDILPKLRAKSAMKKDDNFYHHTMMAGYYAIQEKKLSESIIDLNSSSDPDLRKAAVPLEKQRQKMSAKAAFHHKKKKELHNAKVHGHWNDTIPHEEEARTYGEKFLKSSDEANTPVKPQSLREEAIELARKLGDEQLVKYFKTATMRMVQKRIPALKIAVGKMEDEKRLKKLSKLEQKKFNKTYKYTSDNLNVIKSGTRVLDENGYERVIEEVSDKTLKLEDNNHWIAISMVRFKS